jgi:hypothetical protein
MRRLERPDTGVASYRLADHNGMKLLEKKWE